MLKLLVRLSLCGSATITATSGGKTGSAGIAVTAVSGARVGRYVAPSGTSGGDGSIGRPWNLGTALAGAGGRVQPGDTIWMRGGTYSGDFTSNLTGTPAAPIVLRQYPGERATVDGRLRVFGSDAVYWGFEIMQSTPVANGFDALEAQGPSKKFINLIIHDAGKQGFSFYTAGGVSEFYGSIVYNNGTHEDLDHGVYAANDAGVKYITDNVFFNNMAYGIHVFATADHAVLTDEHVEGNASFNNGAISANGMHKSNLLIGGDQPAQRMFALGNMLYFAPAATGSNMRLGVAGQTNLDILVQGNYVVGGPITLQMESWQAPVVRDNLWFGSGDMVYLTTPGPLSGYVWAGNRYSRSTTAGAWRYQGPAYTLPAWRTATGGLGLADTATGTTPTTPQVFVRANRYEPGRAHVIVYNWSRQALVAVDLTGVVAVGAPYEVRNVQDVFGAPVVSGTYAGGTIAIPMSGVAPPVPIGRATRTPPRTAPDFDVFLVTSGP